MEATIYKATPDTPLIRINKDAEKLVRFSLMSQVFDKLKFLNPKKKDLGSSFDKMYDMSLTDLSFLSANLDEKVKQAVWSREHPNEIEKAKKILKLEKEIKERQLSLKEMNRNNDDDVLISVIKAHVEELIEEWKVLTGKDYFNY